MNAEELRENKRSDGRAVAILDDISQLEISEQQDRAVLNFDPQETEDLDMLYVQATVRIDELLHSYDLRGDYNDLAIHLDELLMMLRLWKQYIAQDPATLKALDYKKEYLAIADGFGLRDVLRNIHELHETVSTDRLIEAQQALTQLQASVSSLTMNTAVYRAVTDRNGEVLALRRRLEDVERGLKQVSLSLYPPYEVGSGLKLFEETELTDDDTSIPADSLMDQRVHESVFWKSRERLQHHQPRKLIVCCDGKLLSKQRKQVVTKPPRAHGRTAFQTVNIRA